jgi:two-component system KDP operon response regulator KdpE
VTLTDAVEGAGGAGGAGGGRREVRLTPTEFKLLAYLVKYAGKVLTHQQILREVWGPTHAKDVQYLRVYAGQLRQKLEPEPAQPRFLLTEPGVGYRLVEPGAPTA